MDPSSGGGVTSGHSPCIAPRRRRLPTLVALLAVGVVAACSGASGGGGSHGVLRYGYDFSAQFTNLDPGKSTGDCDAIAITPIFDTLIHKDLGGNLQPGLATSWQLGKNTVMLHLRHGVTFSDGEAFNADAVKLGLEHLKKDPTYSDLATVTAIDVVDPYTVRVTLKDTPPITLLYSMSGREGMIVAPQHIDEATSHPVGAGPFTFKSLTSGSHLVLTKNPTYWDKGKYDYSGIDFTQVGVGPPSVTALRAGNVDMVSIQPESYKAINNSGPFKVAVQATTAYLQFQFRFAPPFDNLAVRQAVEYAIDRSQINTVVQDGLGEVANQTFFKKSFGYNPSVANLYLYKPQKAISLLKGSGLKLPIHITLVIPGGNITSMERQGAIIQNELNHVGFKVAIKRILGNNIEGGYYLSRSGNAFAAVRPGEPYPPVQLYDQWGKYQFVAIYSSGERSDINRLALRALRARDLTQAAKLTRQAEAIVTKQALDVPIAFSPELTAYNSAVVSGEVHAQTGVCDAPDISGLIVK